MRAPEEIEALADRIDPEHLSRLAYSHREALTPEQKDRFWAGVLLRRYAHHRLEIREKLKEGAEFIRGYKLGRSNNGGTDRFGTGDHDWHCAINAFTADKVGADWPRMRRVRVLPMRRCHPLAALSA